MLGMWRFAIPLAALGFGALSALADTPARPGNAGPVLVELFTSQGCPLCPQANETLAELDARADVVAVALSVDIMDSLGWRDTFAQPAFTGRQRAYCKSMNVRFAYTPQMVIDGAEDVRGSRPGRVTRFVDAAASTPRTAAPSILVERSDNALMVRVERAAITPADADTDEAAAGAAATPSEGADIWLMAFTPGMSWVDVKSGDNAGHRVPVYNAVRDLRHLGVWSGEPLTIDAAVSTDAALVVVQERGLGRVLSVAHHQRTL